MPENITEGITCLMPKTSETDDPKYYKPITCLWHSLVWVPLCPQVEVDKKFCSTSVFSRRCGTRPAFNVGHSKHVRSGKNLPQTPHTRCRICLPSQVRLCLPAEPHLGSSLPGSREVDKNFCLTSTLSVRERAIYPFRSVHFVGVFRDSTRKII